MDLKKKMEIMTEMLMKKKFWAVCCTVGLASVLALNLSGCTSGTGSDDEVAEEELPQQEIEIPGGDDAASSGASVAVPGDDTDKMVSVSVENMGRSNPFLPPGEAALISERAKAMADAVPNAKLQYDLLPPLETPEVDTDARRAVTTKISGIMYDKSNPSAILNFDGMDYLVRSGDVINGYKVLAIGQSTVTVQVGSNIYSAGVGQLVNEGKKELNYNTVANLSSKFGGAGRK